MRRLVVTIVLLMSIPGIALAGARGIDTSGCAGFGEGATVVMRDSCFGGTAHFVSDGTTITIDNQGALPHTFTAVDGSFDTGTVAAGSSADLEVGGPGIYRVFCSLHGTARGDGMAGVLVVGDAGPASEQTASDGTETDLLVALEQMGAAAPPGAPQVVTIEGEMGPAQLVIVLMAGLAVGLGLAALLTVLRLRIADRASIAERPADS